MFFFAFVVQVSKIKSAHLFCWENNYYVKFPAWALVHNSCCFVSSFLFMKLVLFFNWQICIRSFWSKAALAAEAKRSYIVHICDICCGSGVGCRFWNFYKNYLKPMTNELETVLKDKLNDIRRQFDHFVYFMGQSILLGEYIAWTLLDIAYMHCNY